MSELLKQQWQFSQMAALWVRAAYVRGFNVTYGDAFRDPRATHPYSFPGTLHAKRLAVDFNLFDQNGKWLTTLEEWNTTGLGKLWRTMGGTWGGDFAKPDPNHLSLGEGR